MVRDLGQGVSALRKASKAQTPFLLMAMAMTIAAETLLLPIEAVAGVGSVDEVSTARGVAGIDEIQNVQLVGNYYTPELEFTLHAPAFDSEMSAHLEVSGDGIRYHYHEIPDSEYLRFQYPDDESQKLNHIHIAKATASFNRYGALFHTDLPDTIPETSAHRLIDTLEQGLTALAQSHTGAFQALPSHSYALVTTDSFKWHIAIYSDGSLLAPRIKITWTPDSNWHIQILDNGAPATLTPPIFPLRKMELVFVHITHKESFAQKALDYLDSILLVANRKDLTSALTKVGLGGEVPIPQVETKTEPEVHKNLPRPNTPEDYTGLESFNAIARIPDSNLKVNIQKTRLDRRPVIDLSRETNKKELLLSLHQITKAIQEGHLERYRVYPGEIGRQQFVVSPSMHKTLDRLIDSFNTNSCLNVYTQDLMRRVLLYIPSTSEIRESLVCLENRPNTGIPVQPKVECTADITQQKENSYEALSPAAETHSLESRTLTKNIHSFMTGAVVGGTIGSGLHIHNHYRTSNKLPHQYNLGEWKNLTLKTLHDGTRYGISSVASQNLVDAGMPPLAAGAIMGIANTLYDGFWNGDLSHHGLLSTVTSAGAASVVAGIGAHIARTGALSIPVVGQTLPTQTAASLTGGFMGQLAYQYLINNSARTRH